MSLQFNWSEETKRITLTNGSAIILFDRLGLEHHYNLVDCARNIFLISADGNVIWQVKSNFDADGDPFTNIFYENEELKGYRWDGCTYLINTKNGHATPDTLMK